MKTYVDLELEKVVLNPGTGQFVEELTFKRNLSATVEVQFVRRGAAEELPADATGILGLKPVGQYDADYVVAALAWVKTGSGPDTLYTFTLSFINPDLDALFKVDGDPENDVVSIELMGELQWIFGGTTYKSQTFTVTIVNDVNRGGETVPDLPPLAFGVYLPSITGLTGGASSDLDAVPTVTLRTGYIVQVLIDNGSSDLQWLVFVLTAGAASAPGDVAPLDYDATSNNRHWRGAYVGGAGAIDKHYTHDQPVAAATWTMNHGLGKRPSVTVVDSAGTEVKGEIIYDDLNTCRALFSAPFSGTAELN